MKKNFTKSVCMALIAVLFAWSLNAQELIQQLVPTSGNTYAKVSADDTSGTINYPSHGEIFRSPGEVLFYEGFETTTGNGIPTGWTRIGAAVTGTTPVAGAWCSVGTHSLTSFVPYAGSRQMVCLKYQFTGQLNAWLFTPAINMTAGTSYTITFALACPSPGYSGFTYDYFKAQIGTSTEITGTGNNVTMVGGITMYNTTDNNFRYTIISYEFIPTTAGDYHIGFHNYSSLNAVGVYLDEVMVRETPNNDLEIIADYPFVQVPVSQAMISTLNSKVNNLGAQPQTNVVVTADLNGTTIGTSTPIASLASGATASPTVPTGNPAILSGNNTLTLSVDQTQTDEVPENNSVALTIIGTPDTYAVENITELPAGGTGFSSANVTFGNIYDISTDVTLTHISVGFATNATTELGFEVSFYKMDGANFIATDLVSATPATRPVGGGWVNVSVPPVTLQAGERYLCCVRQLTTTNMGLAYLAHPIKCFYVCQTDLSLYDGNKSALAIRMIISAPDPEPECNPASALTVNYSNDCGTAQLSWNAPGKKSIQVMPKMRTDEPVVRSGKQKRDAALKTTMVRPQGTSTTSKGVDLFEDFEGCEIFDLPDGWTEEAAGDEWWWLVDDDSLWEEGYEAYSGQQWAACWWDDEYDRNAWMYSPGIPMTAGTEYTISFWVITGYMASDGNRFEVKLAQSATISAMNSGTQIYRNTNAFFADWHNITYTYTPTTTGTYYLGFHEFTYMEDGYDTLIDDVSVTSEDGPTPGDITYNIYRDNAPIGTTTETTFADNTFVATAGHTWSVKVACGSEESAAVSAFKPACNTTPGDCDSPTNLTATYQYSCDVVLNWTAPGKGKSGAKPTSIEMDEQTKLKEGSMAVGNRPKGTGTAARSFLAAPEAFKTTSKPATPSAKGPGTAAYMIDTENYSSFKAGTAPLNNPTNFTPLNGNINGAFPTGGDWINGEWYYVSPESSSIYKVNTTTGAATVASTFTFASGALGLAYNPADGLTYINDENGNFYTVNLATGASTYKFNVSAYNAYFFTITNDGRMISFNHYYGYEIIEINTATGATTVLMTYDFPTNYGQDMSMDRETNTVYWAAYESDGYSYGKGTLYRLDLECGGLTKVKDFNGGAQTTALAIPTDVPNTNAPKAPTNFTATSVGSSLTCNLAWTLPTQTVGGGALGTITNIIVERNGTPITLPGTATTYTDNVPASGVYIYAVYAVNAAGNGYYSCPVKVMLGDMCEVEITVDSNYGDDFYWEFTDDATGAILVDGGIGTFTEYITGGNSGTYTMYGIGYWGDNWASADIYLNGDLVHSFYTPAVTTSGVIDTYNVSCEGSPSFFTYNIYRDNTLIADNVTATTYTDNAANFDYEAGHVWSVRIACEEGGESTPAAISLEACPYDPDACSPVLDLQAAYIDGGFGQPCSAELTWEMPDKKNGNVLVDVNDPKYDFVPNYTYEEKAEENLIFAKDPNGHTISIESDKSNDWVQWCTSTIYDGIGTGSAMTWKPGMRFTPADMIVKDIADGDLITKIKLVTYNTSFISACNIQIYQGGTWPSNQGTLKYQQSVPVSSLLQQQYTEITLNEPVEINASQELWIVYELTVTGSYCGGADQGPMVDNKGNILYWNGEWTTLAIAGGSNNLFYNWCIQAYVEQGGERCDPVTNLTATNNDYAVTLNWTAPAGAISYEVSRAGMTTTTVTTTTFTETVPANGTYNYTVKAIFPAADDCIPSGASVTTVVYVSPCGNNGEEVIIGTTTTGSYQYPLNTYYNYSYTQSIFDASEIGDPGKIISLGYQYFYSTAQTNHVNQTIYMAHTDKSTFSTTGDWLPISAFTQVYTGTINFNNANTWYTIDLDVPFEYEGGNLIIAYVNNAGTYNTGSNNTFYTHTTTGNKSLRYYTDGSPINPTSPPTASANEGVRPNVRFEICRMPGGFNIFRDDVLVKEMHKQTNYLDEGFDSYEPHTWTVLHICEDLSESYPMTVSLEPCKFAGDCDAPEELVVTYDFDCTANLVWGVDGGKKSAMTQLTHANHNTGEVGARGERVVMDVTADRVSGSGISQPPVGEGAKVYADAYVGDSFNGNYCSLNLTTGAKTTVGSMPSTPFPSGEDFDGTDIYRLHGTGGFGMLLKIAENGATSTVGTLTGATWNYTVGLAYDWISNNGKWYFLDIANSTDVSLYTFTMGSMTATKIGATNVGIGFMRGLTLADDGNLYSLTTSTWLGGPSYLIRINPTTGAATSVGSIGFPALYGFELAFDRADNILYCSPFNDDTEVCLFGTINYNTGAWSQIMNYGNGQHATIVITKNSNPNLAKAPTNFTATPVGSSFKCNLSWTNPTQTVGGTNLTSISQMVVQRNGSTIIALPGNPGANMSYTDVVPVAGEYSYSVYAVTSEGNGQAASASAVVGGLCDVRFEMFDCYGDGWNGGGKVEIQIDGVIVGTVTLPSGSYGSQTLLLPSGEMKLYWRTGGSSYDGECEFETYVNDELIYVSRECISYGGAGYGMDGMNGVCLFTYELNCGGGGTMYNVYRDGTLIAQEVEGIKYTDYGYDPYEEHTWCVTKICPNGFEAIPFTCASLPACADESPCNDLFDLVVGTGTGTTYRYPANNLFKYSYIQEIYDASELSSIQSGQQITAISFEYAYGTPVTKIISVYLGETSKTSFASSSDWVAFNNLEHVFTGTITFSNSTQWTTIELTDPYTYNGGNLVVAVNNTTGLDPGSSYVYRCHTLSTNKVLHAYTDASAYNPASPGIGNLQTERNNIMFTACDGGLTKDLAALSISGNTHPTITIPYNYVVTIKNNGTETESGYAVQVRTAQNEVLAEVHGNPIEPSEVQTYTLPVTFWPENIGDLCLKGGVILEGDQNPVNNSTPLLCITVRPYSDDEIIDYPSDPWIGGPIREIPFNFYYNSSMVQSVYHSADLDIAGGYIKVLSWFYNHTGSVPQVDKPVKVYLANTTQATIAASWLPLENFKLVYDGTVTVPLGLSQISVPLIEPFLYTGANLVVMTERLFAGPYHDNVMGLTTTVTPTGRSREYHTDVEGSVFNWSQPGTAINNISNIEMVVQRVPYGVISGKVTECETGEPIEGAIVTLNHYGITVTTDANGNYNIPFAPAGEGYTITVTKYLYYDEVVEPFDIVEGEYIYDFCMTLRDGYVVYGVVQAADGTYIEGANLTLKGYADYTATSGSMGTFEFLDILWASDYTLTVTYPGYQVHTSTWDIYENTNMGTIILYDLTYKPTDVIAVDECDDVWIHWDAPVPGKSISVNASKMNNKEGNLIYVPDGDSRGVIGYKLWRLTPGNEGDETTWALLTINPVNAEEFYDYSWAHLSAGSYKYAVRTVYHGLVQSEPTFSNSVHRYLAPNNLEVETVSECSHLLTWGNQPPVEFEPFFDDMESYQDWIISDIGEYTLIDVDGAPTFGHSIYTWPHQWDPKAYIVFNPATTSPSMVGQPEVEPYSGTKFLAAFNADNSTYSQDDWLILPKMKIAAGVEFSFWAKSFNDQYNLERFKIGVSTTDPVVSAFTFIQPGNYVTVPITWTKYSYDLSAYAGKEVYLAIECVSVDSWAFLVDDISVDIPGKNRDPLACFQGYTIYLDGVVAATGIMDEEYLFTNLPAGDYIAGVQAVYSYGASEIVEVEFTSECPPPVYTVTFNVTDGETGEPIEDAIVIFDEVTLPAYVAENILAGTYEYTVSKEEYVTVTGEVNVIDADVMVDVLLYLSGIDENGVNYQIYPNPTSEFINIQRVNATDASIDIYNAMGMHIANYNTIEVIYEIDVTALAAGTYFIRVTEGTNSTVKSFVKKQ